MEHAPFDGIRVRAGEVLLEVRCASAEVAKGLEAAWPTVVDRGPATTCVDAEATDRGFVVRIDDRPIGECDEPVDLLPLVELAMYTALADALLRTHSLLHGAGLVVDERPLLFFARSGGGKSSFALEGERRGHRLLSDEMLATDGERLFGVPRAIQFEARPIDERPIPRLADLDRSSYRFRDTEGRDVALPLAPLSEERIDRRAHDVHAATVVVLRHGDRDALLPLGSAEAIARICQVATYPPRHGLGRLAGAGRCFELVWSSVETAFDLALRAHAAARSQVETIHGARSPLVP